MVRTVADTLYMQQQQELERMRSIAKQERNKKLYVKPNHDIMDSIKDVDTHSYHDTYSHYTSDQVSDFAQELKSEYYI